MKLERPPPSPVPREAIDDVDLATLMLQLEKMRKAEPRIHRKIEQLTRLLETRLAEFNRAQGNSKNPQK